MNDVTDATLHQFGQNVLVELLGVDDRGDVATETVEFEVLDGAQERVKPCGEIPPDRTGDVRGVLSENGYSIVDA